MIGKVQMSAMKVNFGNQGEGKTPPPGFKKNQIIIPPLKTNKQPINFSIIPRRQFSAPGAGVFGLAGGRGGRIDLPERPLLNSEKISKFTPLHVLKAARVAYEAVLTRLATGQTATTEDLKALREYPAAMAKFFGKML